MDNLESSLIDGSLTLLFPSTNDTLNDDESDERKFVHYGKFAKSFK